MQDQNHQAHIEAHILFVQNPAVSQNPEFYANVVQDVMQHIGFLAQSQVQGMQQQGMQQQALPQGMQQPAQLPQGFANGGMAQLPQGMPQQGIPQGPSVEEIEAKLIAEILPRLAPPQQEDPLVQLQGSQIEMQRENNSLDYQAALAKIESSENIASAKISADLIKDDQKAEIAVAKESLNHLERQEDRQMQAQQQFNQQGAM
jgi:predicted ATP-grasp superfamily ATP-dependent carboligase